MRDSLKEPGDRAIRSSVTRSPRSFAGRLSTISPRGRHLLAAAAVLHVALAAAINLAGRAQVAPGLVDRDGIIGSFASDSYEYQQRAARLAQVLREGGLRAWAAEGEPAHVRLISVEFALLAPLFGYSTLSAEPLNLLCYLAVVALVLALGREVGGARAGLAAAAAAALWPTFLLHTTQLLKDPLFIAAALALILTVTTWLTREYGRRGAAVTGALVAAAAGLLLLIRAKFALVIFALVLFGLALLVVRQLLERRALYWNMVAPVLILAVGVPAYFYASAGQRVKHYPSDGGGPPKSVADAGVRLPTSVTYLPGARPPKGTPLTFGGRLRAAADRVALGVGGVRYRFNFTYSESGSGVDREVEIRDFGGLVRYVPRAFEIGMWAPFPETWAGAGRRVGSAGRLLSGAETFVIYLCELLALAAVARPPRRLAAWLLLSITMFGVTGLGLVVSNVGTLYRLRYTFWMLLVVLGVKGLAGLVAPARLSAWGRVSRRGAAREAA